MSEPGDTLGRLVLAREHERDTYWKMVQARDAQIEQLRARLTAAESDADNLRGVLKDTLQELAEAKATHHWRDAARYRWLRDYWFGSNRELRWRAYEGRRPTASVIDASIDDAMRAVDSAAEGRPAGNVGHGHVSPRPDDERRAADDLFLTTFRARFEPQRRDDLRPEAAAVIGAEFVWQRSWIIEDGPYAGQWACAPRGEAAPFGWAPECDLILTNG